MDGIRESKSETMKERARQGNIKTETDLQMERETEWERERKWYRYLCYIGVLVRWITVQKTMLHQFTSKIDNSIDVTSVYKQNR